MRLLLVLSGGVGSGKSTLASALRDLLRARVVNTRDLILAVMPDVEPTRGALQKAGDALDAETGGAWVADGLSKLNPDEDFVVLDAVRRAEQIDAIRRRFPEVVVTHVHLQASETVMSQRYDRRARPGDERLDYAAVRKNATEEAVARLSSSCDMLVDTLTDLPEMIASDVAARLGI
jgi:adenylosuccinate synthase